MKNVGVGTVIGIAAITGIAAAALASETVTYTYDARGRVVAVKHTGTINNGMISNYAFDKADNRKNVKVTGAP